MSLTTITNNFYSKLKDAANEVASLIFNRSKGISIYADEQLLRLIPIYDDLFNDGQKASIDLIKSDIVKLTGKYDVPMKYSKDLLLKINGESVFTGYFDTKYKNVFKSTEINNLKKTILQAKYSNFTEAQLKTNILNTINVTKKRAQLIARTEISRLRAVTQAEYFKIPGIKKKYDKKFITESGARPSHQQYNGQIADKDGLFHGPLGSFEFAPIPGEYNCRCRVVFIEKE